MVLPLVFGVPRVPDWRSVRVFDVVGSVMYDLSNSIRSFPIRAQDPSALHLGVLEHAPEYKAADGEDPPFDFGVVVSLNLLLLRSESGEGLGSFLVD